VEGPRRPDLPDAQLARVFETAEKAAEKASDSFVTVERLCLPCGGEDSEAGKALTLAASATEDHQAIEALRKGRTADSASPRTPMTP